MTAHGPQRPAALDIGRPNLHKSRDGLKACADAKR